WMPSAQMAAVLDHPGALPQGDGCAGPAFAGGAERGDCKFAILDAGNMLSPSGVQVSTRKVKCVRIFIAPSCKRKRPPSAASWGKSRTLPRSFVEQLALPLSRSPSIATQACGLWDC